MKRKLNYIVDVNTQRVISGSKEQRSTFYENWKFIKPNGVWILDEIRQSDEKSEYFGKYYDYDK